MVWLVRVAALCILMYSAQRLSPNPFRCRPHAARALARHILDGGAPSPAGAPPPSRRRRRLRIVEFGGGNGTLARCVLDYLRDARPDVYDATRYQIVEVPRGGPAPTRGAGGRQKFAGAHTRTRTRAHTHTHTHAHAHTRTHTH